MSRLQQDTFIDEEEEVCPLCVEEFDVQDRNFKPCPCGYQICQFCFNNIRQNLNGLCPACRREYRDDTIVYKAITTEELKAEENKKKRAANEKRKHEAQKREIEALNRKHLSGLRVIQRNLVYVTGLNPRIREDELLATLRGDQYFGQYGRILKIVVNKRTAQGGPGSIHNNHYDNNLQGLGVYVTFSNKSEAEKCIVAVDGSQNGDRTLRATYGTTKYCSAYLRNETCPNKSCMFLHEPGEEAESFSRMELSTANSRQTKEQAYAQPAQTARQSAAAAQQHLSEMARTNSHVGSTSDNDAASALPSTANWAKNPPTPASRPASLVHQATNHHPSKVSTPSPKGSPSSPLVQNVQTVRPQETAKKPLAKPTASTTADALTKATNVNGKPVGIIGQAVPSASTTETVQPTKTPKPVQPKLPAFMMEQVERLQKIQRAIGNPNFRFVLSPKAFSPDEYDALCKIPPMFDKQGGKRRRELMEKLRSQQQQRSEQGDDVPRGEAGPQPPIGTASTLGSIGLSPLGIPNRGTSPPLTQHRESIMPKEAPGLQSQGLQGLSALQQDTLQQQAALGAQTPQGVVQQGGGQQAFGGAFQNGQAPLVPSQHQPGHSRQSSRYTFANDNPMTASTTVTARGNAAHMAEQVRMMPPQQQQQMPPQQLAQMYGGAPGLGGLLGAVQQPPPGLKNAPTPPAPGLGGIPMGNMSQFSGMTLGGHHGKSENESLLLRELLAGSGPSRMGGVTNASLMRGGDGKLDLGDPSILQARVAQPQHQMHQHQQGIQAGSHGQQGNISGIVGFPGLAAAVKSPVPPLVPSFTPGVSDEDFPALAPVKPSTPKPAPVGTKKKDKRPKTSAGALVASTDETTVAIVPADETIKDAAVEADEPVAVGLGESTATKTDGQDKTKPPTIGTTLTSLEEAVSKEREREREIVAPTPIKAANVIASPITTSESPAPTVGKKHAPLTIRLVNSPATISKTGTPAPDAPFAFSDTASITTTTESRPVTPSPIDGRGKKKDFPVTGPALADMPPVAYKSKSAIKKERIAALKEKERKETEEAAAAKAKDVHAPIVGRMKKKDKKGTKKPGDKQEFDDVAEDFHEDAVSMVGKEDVDGTKDDDNIQKGALEEDEDIDNSDEQKAAVLTPAQLLAELRADSDVDFKDLEMFKPIGGLKWENYISANDVTKIRAGLPPINSSSSTTTFTSQVAASANAEVEENRVNRATSPRPTPSIKMTPGSSVGSVHMSLRGGGSFETRMLVTPQGSVLRGLTVEQEKRYIEMEERRRSERSWERWGSAPHPGLAAAAAARLEFPSADKSVTASTTATSPDWKAAVTAHTMAAGLAAAGSVAKHMHLGPEEATRLSTKEALDYLWNTFMPALPGYAQEHLEGLAQSMAMSGCKVSVGFDEGGQVKLGENGEPTVTVDVKVEGGSHVPASLQGLEGLGVKELEKMVHQARKETEALEKKVEKLIKRNRKIVGLV